VCVCVCVIKVCQHTHTLQVNDCGREVRAAVQLLSRGTWLRNAAGVTASRCKAARDVLMA